MSDTVAVPIADLRRLRDYVHRVHYGYFTGPDNEKHIKDAAGPMWALVGGLLEGHTTERLVDHLVGAQVTVYTLTQNAAELVVLMGGDVEKHADEDLTVFDGRLIVDGEEHFTFGGLGPKRSVAAWQVAGLHADGTRLTCTAWEAGIDPRSTLDGMTHVDPEGEQPIGICPIHD